MFLELNSIMNPVVGFFPAVSLSMAVDSAVTVVWKPGRAANGQLSYQPVLHTRAFLSSCLIRKSLPLAGSILKLLQFLFPFLIFFHPFYAFGFSPLNNCNTASFGVFRSLDLGPPKDIKIQ